LTALRIRIIFNLKNKGAFVPLHHQYLLAQQIKGVLLKGQQEEFINYTLYNFSGLKGQTKISRNGLHYYSSKVTLVLSCPDKKFVDYFINQLFDMKTIDVGNLHLVPDSVEIEEEPEFEETTKFICISPMVLIMPKFNDSESKRFISPETTEYSDLVYKSTMLRMEQTGKYSKKDFEKFTRFQVMPDEGYLMRIREHQKKFARIYPVYNQDVKYEVRGYTFPFTLYADPEVQDFIFTCGIGSLTHKGFGMLDLANSDPSKRTKEYRTRADKISN
jgi:CRISPR-associated endoribonuclease Cas6